MNQTRTKLFLDLQTLKDRNDTLEKTLQQLHDLTKGIQRDEQDLTVLGGLSGTITSSAGAFEGWNFSEIGGSNLTFNQSPDASIIFEKELDRYLDLINALKKLTDRLDYIEQITEDEE